ncbi:leucine-rich_repeat domain-containing protein [Hexamita inflata]|uniref:Leucine-rich repeat domain-containing protein n=1 Tax=Hexamita inflata TaxID=28002 RepID=A0AA86Q196_9EUKA|nr:leucine-rich repeat domain-containing protein [Hexamita inflata]
MQFVQLNKIKNKQLTINGKPLESIKFAEELQLNQLTLMHCTLFSFEQTPNCITNLKIKMWYSEIKTQGISQMQQLQCLTINNTWSLNITEIYMLPNLQILNLNNTGIHTIKGMENMRQLKSLSLRNNPIGNQLEILLTLTELVKLDISNTQTTCMSGIKVLQQLKELNISSNQINDYYVLKYLPGLTNLDAQNNRITITSFLKQMKQLQILNLNKNKIESVNDLKFLVNITRLNLNSNNIEDITCLSKLKDLRELHLFKNRIVDISVVRNFRKLVILDVSKNKVINIDALQNLYLVKLNVSHNYISDFSPLQYRASVNTFHYKLFKQLKDSIIAQQAKCIKCVNCSQLMLFDSVSQKISFKKEFEHQVAVLNNRFCGTIVTIQNKVLQYLQPFQEEQYFQ